MTKNVISLGASQPFKIPQLRILCLCILFFFCCWFLFCFFSFKDMISLYRPGCPGTHSVDQAGLEFRNLPASASRVLGLKGWATLPGSFTFQMLSPFLVSSLIILYPLPPLSAPQTTHSLFLALAFLYTGA